MLWGCSRPTTSDTPGRGRGSRRGGEESVRQIFGGTLEHRLAVAAGIGMTGPAAERVAAGFDDGMGQAVLSLLRSAAQPVMADAGRGLVAARQRPGLALLAMADTEASGGTLDQHRRMAEFSGARVAELPGSATGGPWRIPARPPMRCRASGPS